MSGGIDFFVSAATGLLLSVSLLEARDNKKNQGTDRIDRLNKTAGHKWNKGVEKFSN